MKAQILALYHLIPSKIGPINLQSYWVMILSTLILTISIVFTNFSRRPGTSFWDDLINGAPGRGELGYGRFTIYGVTFPMEYPFRLYVRTIMGSITPWLCYVPHQIGQFYIIFKAKEAYKKGEIKWTDNEHWNPYSWAMFKLNLVFTGLHYLQTEYFYDGLAATFPEISTLLACTTAIMLPFILELKRRGVMFGWTPDKLKNPINELVGITKEYHGYFISFGMVLTFWYHPMESTFAHWTGFSYIFLLFWQSVLLFQKAHRNRYWTALLEMSVMIHGAVVAYYQGIMDGVLFAMFFTSFLLFGLITPLWGLPIVKNFVEPNGQLNKFRRNALISIIVPCYISVVYLVFNAIGHLAFIPMCLELPVLYWFFAGWYYMFYVAGKRLDELMIRRGVERKSKIWWNVLIFWGAMSLILAMIIGEVIYRQFVPYSKPGTPY